MTPAVCGALAAYNRWMNARLYDAAAGLSEEALCRDRGAFFGSLFGTLNHLVAADLIWLHRFSRHADLAAPGLSTAGLDEPASLRQSMGGSLPALRDVRTRADEVFVELAGRVTDADLAKTLRYSNTAGRPQSKNFGLLLLHVFNHQTHHRGQATTLLFQAGVDVGVTDLNALIPNEA